VILTPHHPLQQDHITCQMLQLLHVHRHLRQNDHILIRYPLHLPHHLSRFRCSVFFLFFSRKWTWIWDMQLIWTKLYSYFNRVNNFLTRRQSCALDLLCSILSFSLGSRNPSCYLWKYLLLPCLPFNWVQNDENNLVRLTSHFVNLFSSRHLIFFPKFVKIRQETVSLCQPLCCIFLKY
jgi:hypothetical protein